MAHRSTLGSLPPLTDDDLHLFHEGTHLRLFEVLGAHPHDGGTRFAVWAPNAAAIEVIGDWNQWLGGDPLARRGVAGLWEGEVPRAAIG